VCFFQSNAHSYAIFELPSVVVAELDEEEDAKIDFSSVMAAPLKHVMHS
jgi:hypothetical protein